MTHACPCGCGVRVPNSLYSCQSSWASLPDEIKREVYRTAPRKSGRLPDGIAWSERSEALRAARDHFRTNRTR